MPEANKSNTIDKATETNKAWYKEPTTLIISAMSRTFFRKRRLTMVTTIRYTAAAGAINWRIKNLCQSAGPSKHSV